jgi:hypothetical protein
LSTHIVPGIQIRVTGVSCSDKEGNVEPRDLPFSCVVRDVFVHCPVPG